MFFHRNIVYLIEECLGKVFTVVACPTVGFVQEVLGVKEACHVLHGLPARVLDDQLRPLRPELLPVPVSHSLNRLGPLDSQPLGILLDAPPPVLCLLDNIGMIPQCHRQLRVRERNFVDPDTENVLVCLGQLLKLSLQLRICHRVSVS